MIKVRKDIAFMYIADYKKSKKNYGVATLGLLSLAYWIPGRATCVPGLAKLFSLILT